MGGVARLPGALGVIGAGQLGEALVAGLLRQGVIGASGMVASAPRPERRAELERRHGIRTTASNPEAAAAADLLLLSVKPQILPEVLAEIGPAVRARALVVSVAAGVPTALVESALPGARVVRAMPNTPVLVGAGVTALCAGRSATAADLDTAATLFGAVGITVRLPETQMDAVTGLSGSGPAYVFLFLEALADAGVKVGLSRHVAQHLAVHAVLGAARLAEQSGEHPGRLKDMVTSPGGTAIAALAELEAGRLRTTLLRAVEAATARSRELGEALRAPDPG